MALILISGAAYASQEPKPKATETNSHELKTSSKPSPVLGALSKVASNRQDQDWVSKLVQLGGWIGHNLWPVNPDIGNMSVITGGACNRDSGSLSIITHPETGAERKE